MTQVPFADVINQLSPELFWDVDRSQISLERHGKWLLSRILQRGRWGDWQTISRILGPSALRTIEPELKLPARERHFLKVWLDTHDAN